MKFFDPFRYASPLRKALAKKENASRNLRFETLENRALLSVTPLDELQAAVSSAEIAPAYTVETPVVDLSALAVSNATTATDANDDQYEENDALADATPLGVLTETKIVEGIAAPKVNNVYENDYYSFATTYTGTGDHYIQLDVPEGFNVGFLTVSLSNAVNNTANNTFPSSVQVNGACKTISLAGVPAGDYAIQVYSGNAKGVYIPYTLTINPPKPKTDDVYEGQTGNNSIDAATDLGMIGPSTLEATVGPNANADFYKFTLVDDGTEADYLKLDYTETSNVLMNVTIYDQQKKPILTNVNEWTSNKIETFSLAGQKAGDYYVEIVTNQNVAGFSDYTLSIVAPTTAPAAPTNFDASGDKVETEDGTTLFLANEATLSWDAVAHITGYEVRYSSDDGKTWTTETLAPNQTSFDLTELAYATEYLCQVRAVRISDGFYDWNVASKWEDSALKFTTVDAPVAPELAQPELTLETFKPSEQKIALTWTNVAYERGYVVQTFDANGAWVDASERLAADTTTWTTDKLELNATYVYRVVAFNNAGETASAQITVVTPNVPAPPSGLTVAEQPSETPSAKLTWEAATETGIEAVVDYTVTVYRETVDAETGETSFVAVSTQTVETATATVEGLVHGKTYYFEVVARNAYGASAASQQEELTVGDVPTQPQLEVVFRSSTFPKATLTWDAEPATVYIVEQLVDESWTTVATLENGESEWTTDELVIGQTYSYRVGASNAYGGETSEVATFVAPPLATPVLNEITLADYDKATKKLAMTWSDVDDETHYRIQFSYDGVTWTTSQNMSQNETSRFASTNRYDTTYYFRVRAENAYGVSYWSNVVSFTTPSPSLATPVLNEFTLDDYNETTKKLAMSWSDVDDETHYRVQFSYDGVTWTTSQNMSQNETSRFASVPRYNTTYYFRVQAVNAFDVSEWSNVVSFTTPSPSLTAPVLNEFTLDDYNVTTKKLAMSWSDVDNEARYLVQFSYDGVT
ncbi:MAG: fibronectin type III domain-containing protein, partial [Thermoguttaceae bacterium]|nr:fibronectin type III domain-containing protein [Thermoguttaceae bacterium]